MINSTIPIGDERRFPRRDLMAIIPYLNRKELRPGSASDMVASCDAFESLSLHTACSDHRQLRHANDE